MGMMPFGIEQTHGMLLQPGVKIAANSDGRDWTSLFASEQYEPPFEGVFEPRKDQLFLLVKSGPQVTRSSPRKGTEVPIGPGSFFVPRAGETIAIDYELRDTPIETMHVYVRREVIDEVALEMVDGDPARLQTKTQYISSNPILQSLVETSVTAAKDDTMGTSMFADYLSRAIAAQWIRTCTGARLRNHLGDVSGGRNSKALSEAIDFLNDNIDQSISLEDIGRATNRSASHVSRMFSSELGMPPHQYLMRLRVNKAKTLLAKTSISIAEIAYECGFSHQEHLSRLFRRFTDTTPAAYRRSKRN